MMFVDLVSKFVGDAGAEAYSYISMGATFLYDHHEVYRRVGVENLVSFGHDRDDIRRQHFNRPAARMECICMDSSELPDQIDDCAGSRKKVIWLDYMSPKDRRIQLQEVEELLRKLTDGDMLRVTMNAEMRKFGSFDAVARKEYASVQEMAAAKLKEQIADYLPNDLFEVDGDSLPLLLSNAIRLSGEVAMKHRSDLRLVPLLITSYADGDRMMTAAFAVRSRKGQAVTDSIRRWRHRSKSWNDIKVIQVPDLSLREKYHLDRKLRSSAGRILSSLPFRPEDEGTAARMKVAIESYKLFHRYYPAFHQFHY